MIFPIQCVLGSGEIRTGGGTDGHGTAFSERGYGGMTSKEWRRVTLHRKCLLRVCYQFLYTELDKTLTCIAQKCSHLF